MDQILKKFEFRILLSGWIEHANLRPHPNLQRVLEIGTHYFFKFQKQRRLQLTYRSVTSTRDICRIDKEDFLCVLVYRLLNSFAGR